MKLEAIISAICESVGDLAPEDVWADLVAIRGSRSFRDAQPGYSYEPGRPPVQLHRDLIVEGRYLLFEEVGHYPISCLFPMDSKAALERAILDPGGYLNAFTTRAVCLIDGKVALFDVIYAGLDGSEQRFDKAAQQSQPDPFDTEYPNARIVWREVCA